jgi:hypothetical protein
MNQIRGGVFTRADARACGYPDPDIDSLLDTGGWRRIRPGTYAPHQTLTVVDDEMLHLRRLFHVLRRGEPGLIASHQSAAALHALPLWGLDLTNLHVTTRSGRAGLHAGGIHRHVRDPVGPGVTVWNKLRLVTPARAVAEVAATSPTAPAVVLAEAALYAGLVTASDLKRAANQLAGGRARAQQVLALVSGRAASVAEARLRLILAEADLPVPASVPPPAPDAADQSDGCLWFPDQRTVVEFEPRGAFWTADLEGYLEEVEQAFAASPACAPDAPEPLEYCWVSWADLDEPAGVVAELRRAFARADRRTGVRPFNLHRRRRPLA